MQIGTSILTSKISRRFFILFLLCALLPMGIFVWVSYQRVSDQLYEQTNRRLRNDTKIYGMALMDRLVHMNNLLQLYSIYAYSTSDPVNLPDGLQAQLIDHFDGIALYQRDMVPFTLMGSMDREYEAEYLRPILDQLDTSTIYSETSGDLNKSISIILPFTNPGIQPRLLIGQPKTDSLWGVGALSVLPPMTELAVYNEQGMAMIASSASPGSTLPPIENKSIINNYLQFEYTIDNERHLASGWSLFLQSYFNAQTWTVVLSESRANALRSMLEFKRIFPLVVALTLWIILFLSLFFIRRTLAPVTALRRGTELVAAKDFSSKVEIHSGDEFEQLAESFNKMTGQLNKQFNALEVRSEIDRSILSSLDQSIIVPRALRMMFDFFGCHTIMLAQLIQWEQGRISLTSLTGSARNNLQEEFFSLSEDERHLLFDNEKYHILERTSGVPSIIRNNSPADTFLILPMGVENRINGSLILNLQSSDDESSKEEILQARQLANQLAVALSNSRLYDDLEKLSIGTVAALARTVDAKSKWTAGHSERVADLAVRIAQVMGFKSEDQNTLHRAGLLHDIGKIGIPMKLLDKPGKLTDEEYDAIKTHPALGGKILEPIEVYKDIIPLVEQHHERYDGKGYPQGLAGKEIDLAARILCVADVYDALISQRPYRDGWVKEKVLSFMDENKGVMFDPEVADVLLALDI